MSARRKKSTKGSLKVVRVAKPGEMTLTRREVAERELVEAIRQFFSNGDPVVIHLLAHAAHDVIEPIAKAAGKKTLRDILDARVSDQYLDSWRAVRKEVYNFFKHGGKGAADQLAHFRPVQNKYILLEACVAYSAAFSDPRVEINLFQFWFLSQHPEMLSDEGKTAPNPILEQTKGMTDETRRQHMINLLDAAKFLRDMRS